jgi:pimeloyl-ACP methyl ester carboxylesterase
MPDYHPVLGSLLPDAEILVGELDERYRRAAEAMAAAMPAAPLHTVAGAGHNLVLEAPGAVAELLGGRREVAL